MPAIARIGSAKNGCNIFATDSAIVVPAIDACKQRQVTLGLGGRQAMKKAKTLNLLLLGGRAIQKVSADNSQPSWIAYVDFQVLLGPHEP